jgi:hypothetical protein
MSERRNHGKKLTDGLLTAEQKSLRKVAPTHTVQTTSDAAVVALQKDVCEACGVNDPKLAAEILGQAAALQVWGRFKTDPERVAGALAILHGLNPENATQALLAVQMVGVHHNALMFLRRASLEGQTFDGSDANVLRATRLMRVFNEQLEAMQKLKGKAGQQKVTVEHVHIHEGGQAIVGAVAATGLRRGVGDGTENQ